MELVHLYGRVVVVGEVEELVVPVEVGLAEVVVPVEVVLVGEGSKLPQCSYCP